MNNPLDEIVLSFALRGWRDRSSGTMHLGPCPDFDSIDADLVEDAVWRPARRYERLCPACFSGLLVMEPARLPRRRIEPYGY